jgi:hypothetical protein
MRGLFDLSVWRDLLCRSQRGEPDKTKILTANVGVVTNIIQCHCVFCVFCDKHLMLCNRFLQPTVLLNIPVPEILSLCAPQCSPRPQWLIFSLSRRKTKFIRYFFQRHHLSFSLFNLREIFPHYEKVKVIGIPG